MFSLVTAFLALLEVGGEPETILEGIRSFTDFTASFGLKQGSEEENLKLKLFKLKNKS